MDMEKNTMFDKVLDFFIAWGNPWAILFTLSFIYMILTNARRESERRNEVKEYHDKLDSDLKNILQNTTLMLQIWNMIIQRELERRDK